jgi:CRISPR/Cas system CMR subunit Cmr4 (Cas7 group RAMP superfamily)
VSPQVRERYLRLEVVSPANLGSAAGEASLDRPTQKEAWFDLPYLPDSALKGVIAAPYASGSSEGEEGPRERLFGSPDHGPRRGKPGKVVIGNGELLAFPAPLRSGGAAWVFPALAAARFLGFEEGAEEPALRLLSEIEAAPKRRLVFGWPTLPDLASPVALEPVPGELSRAGGAALLEDLRRLAGPALAAGACVVVAASDTAAALWRAAAERRAFTALEAERRTVARGSLRAVELVPDGAVFLSRLSLLDGIDLELPARLQVGAWESLGLGWVRPSFVEPARAGAAESVAAAPTPERLPPETRTMVAMHEAVERLRGRGDAKLSSAARSAVGNFGPRAHFSELAAALAFELAKAKLAHPKPSDEARAHRWLATALLTREPDPVQAPGPCRALLAWLGDAPFDPAKVAGRRGLILARWRWLRRYAELGLGD